MAAKETTEEEETELDEEAAKGKVKIQEQEDFQILSRLINAKSRTLLTIQRRRR